MNPLPPSAKPVLADRLYRVLLSLYPRRFRERFGVGMAYSFSERRHDIRNRGSAVLAWFWVTTVCHTVIFGLAQRLSWLGKVRNRLTPRTPQPRRGSFVDELWQDIQFAAKGFARTPGFTAVAVLTLALGIGATTAIFSVVNGVILRPLPYNGPDGLVMIRKAIPERGITDHPMSQPDLRSIQSEAHSLRVAAGYSASQLTVTGMGEAELIRGAQVTDGLLEVFQEPPFLGRDIRREENVPGGPRVVVIGHAFWQERFGGDRMALGRTLDIGGEPHEIVGVAPPGFDFPSSAQLWVPLYLDTEDCGRGCHLIDVIGRLADGASLGTARSELTALAQRLEEKYPEDNYGKRFDPITLEEDVVGDVRTALLVLLGAVGIVLLIACANVANLLLARASTRAGEMAMRSALGAARGRIVQQLLIEALVLASLAGIAGVALARGGLYGLLRLAPSTLPRLDTVTMDGTVLLVALGTVVLTTGLFGLAPALRLAGTPVATILNQSGRGGPGGPARDRSRSALLVAEVALSLILLSGAGLLLRSFSKLNAVELGFEKERVLTFRLSLPDVPYDDDVDRAVRFFQSLEEQVRSLPGIESVGSVYGSPLAGYGMGSSGYLLDRPEPPEGQGEVLTVRIVTPGYHEALRIPLIGGRALERTDRNGVSRAALVSQQLVERYYQDQDPIGKQIHLDVEWGYGHEEPWTIVGVVGDIRSQRITRAPGPEVYVPLAQMGSTYMSVVVRSAPGVAEVLPAIRREVQALDPNVPLRGIEMLEETVDRQLGPARFYLMLFTIFAGVAVMLAGIGLYGVVAYVVSRRTREIGIRMALGAKGSDVVRMVLSQGIRPAVVGIVLGVGGAYWGSRVLQSLLYNVEPGDITTFAGVTAALFGVVILAILLPARRASRIAPVEALRLE